MGNNNRYIHVIDAIFPIAVFFVFAASSLAVLLMSARIYNETNIDSGMNYRHRTVTAYIMEKTRQNDYRGGISCSDMGDGDCLTFINLIDGRELVTYIYVYEGYMREITAIEGVEVKPEDGTIIAEASGLVIEEPEKGLYKVKITCGDRDYLLTLGERSAK